MTHLGLCGNDFSSPINWTLSDRCKYKFLNKAVAGGVDSDRTVLSLFCTYIHGFAFQKGADIALRIVSIHLIKENIPHLIIGTKILDLSYHFVFHILHQPSNSVIPTERQRAEGSEYLRDNNENAKILRLRLRLRSG